MKSKSRKQMIENAVQPLDFNQLINVYGYNRDGAILLTNQGGSGRHSSVTARRDGQSNSNTHFFNRMKMAQFKQSQNKSNGFKNNIEASNELGRTSPKGRDDDGSSGKSYFNNLLITKPVYHNQDLQNLLNQGNGEYYNFKKRRSERATSPQAFGIRGSSRKKEFETVYRSDGARVTQVSAQSQANGQKSLIMSRIVVGNQLPRIISERVLQPDPEEQDQTTYIQPYEVYADNQTNYGQVMGQAWKHAYELRTPFLSHDD